MMLRSKQKKSTKKGDSSFTAPAKMFRSKQKSSKGASSFTAPDSITPKAGEEEDDAEEEESESEEDSEEEEEEEEVVQGLVPKKKQAYKVTSSSNSTGDATKTGAVRLSFRNRVPKGIVQGKAADTLQPSTSSPTKEAQPKHRQEQGHAAGMNSSSSASVEANTKVSIQDDRNDNDSQAFVPLVFDNSLEIKAIAQVDLTFETKVRNYNMHDVLNNASGDNTNQSLFIASDSYDLRIQSIMPVVEDKLPFNRYAIDAYLFAMIASYDQFFDGTLSVFRFKPTGSSANQNGITSILFKNGLFYKDSASPYGLRFEPGDQITQVTGTSCLKPKILELHTLGNYIEIKTQMCALLLFVKDATARLEKRKMSDKVKFSVLWERKVFITASSSSTTGTISSPVASDMFSTVSPASSSRQKGSSTYPRSSGSSNNSSSSSSSSTSPRSSTLGKNSSSSNSSSSNSIDVSNSKPGVTASMAPSSLNVDTYTDADIVIVSISVDTLRLLGMHLLSFEMADTNEPSRVFLTNNTQHVVLHGVHYRTHSEERIDLGTGKVVNTDVL